jgi:hypothetical protein
MLEASQSNKSIELPAVILNFVFQVIRTFLHQKGTNISIEIPNSEVKLKQLKIK